MLQQYVLIAAIWLVYWLYKRYYFSVHYLKKSKIPQPPAGDFFRGNGNLLNNLELKNTCDSLHKLFGDTFGITSGTNVFVYTNDADLLYKIYKEQANTHVNRGDTLIPSDLMNDHSLLANEGQNWLRCRNIIGPELTTKKLHNEGIQEDLNDATECVLNYIQEQNTKSQADTQSAIVDVGKLFKRFTLDTVLRTLYDKQGLVDYSSDTGDKNFMLKTLMRIIEKIYHPAFVWFQYIPILRPVVLWIDRVTTNFRGALIQLAERALENRTVGANGPRLKHKLLDAFDAGRLSRAELWGNAAFMVAAGWDTTAQSLAAFTWLMATNPEKQAKLRDDIVRDGHKSKYLDWCIRETLRLFPPALTARCLAHDVEWKGMTLRKGMRLVPSIFNIHRKAEYWGNDADTFRPERFAPEESSAHHKAQFFAFGLGPRNCVGGKLAMLEMQLLIARLITKFSIQACEDTPKSLKVELPLIFVPVIRDRVLLKFVEL
ncbi:Cytochrome protein [Fragariocoptes setiger]|uniref:Cytochrome protein n=1 Tax=Fragariocoptes setiger TaxID=1670756 RepID=A0ABQ7SB07_9ACAR|nr:Cytochrome protein [Fragariocoptes setiger]